MYDIIDNNAIETRTFWAKELKKKNQKVASRSETSSNKKKFFSRSLRDVRHQYKTKLGNKIIIKMAL